MTSWSRAEEKDFQELVRRAEQQSKEYYRRAGGKVADPPAPHPAPQRPNSAVTVPPQRPNSAVTVPSLPCLPAPTPAPQGPGCAATASPPAPQCSSSAACAPPPLQKGKGLLGGLGLDMETMLLLALLWLLWQEEADYRVILAIAYILLV